MDRRHGSVRPAAIGLALAVLGCATEPGQYADVKAILADRVAYLRSESFAPNALPLPVREAVVATRTPSPASRTLTLTIDRTAERNGQMTTARGVVSIEPVSDGFVHMMTEFSSNGIPFRTNFALCYLGMDCLRHQSVMHRASLPEPFAETVELRTLTPGKQAPVEGVEYVTDMDVRYRAGVGTVSSMPVSERHVCRAGPRYPAAQVHPKLTGQAVDLTCDILVRGVLQGRLRHAVLLDYGLGVESELSTVESVVSVRIVDVTTSPGRGGDAAGAPASAPAFAPTGVR